MWSLAVLLRAGPREKGFSDHDIRIECDKLLAHALGNDREEAARLSEQLSEVLLHLQPSTTCHDRLQFGPFPCLGPSWPLRPDLSRSRSELSTGCVGPPSFERT